MATNEQEMEAARLQPHAALIFALGTVVLMGMSPFVHELLRAGAVGVTVFAIGMLVSIFGVGGAAGMTFRTWWLARKDPAIRAEVADERAMLNFYRSMSMGYNAMYVLGLAILVTHNLDWWTIPPYWGVFCVVAVGLLTTAAHLYAVERSDDVRC